MNIKFLHFKANFLLIIITVFSTFFLHINFAKAYSKIHSENNFFIIAESGGKDFIYYKIENYLYRIESLVYHTLGQNFNFKNCKVYLNDNSKELIECLQSNKGNWKINLQKDYAEIIDNKQVSAKLFGIIITSMLNMPYSGKKLGSINWYISALNRKLYRMLKPNAYPENASFTVTNFLLMNGYELKPERILNDLSKADMESVYEFNSEVSEVFLNTVLSFKNSEKILKIFLQKSYMSGKRDNLKKIFYSVLSKFLKLKRNGAERYFTEQLNITADKYSLNLLSPASYYYIQRLFNSACIFTYSSEKERNIEVEANLEDLAEIYSDIEPDQFLQIRQELSRRFIKLQRIAPFSAQKPINGIIECLNNFAMLQKKGSFKEKSLNYKIKFNQAIIKEKEIQNFLREKELKHVRVPVRYYNYFKVISTGEDFQNKIWPGLSEYLTLEYKY